MTVIKAPHRSKSIGTKVTEEEYTSLEAHAGASGVNMSEWVRTVLLEQRQQRGQNEAMLAELLGLRAILLNLLFAIGKGETLTAEQMKTLIDKGDAGKLERARKLLAGEVKS